RISWRFLKSVLQHYPRGLSFVSFEAPPRAIISESPTKFSSPSKTIQQEFYDGEHDGELFL
ncbi:MAG: hypothetical protein LKI36_07195, partial [Mesosutterella multiformis]|nr:hypothetical protein [Mesosutterella multiformis]